MMKKCDEAFRKNGGAKIILDVMDWSKEDFEKLKLSTYWVYEIVQLI